MSSVKRRRLCLKKRQADISCKLKEELCNSTNKTSNGGDDSSIMELNRDVMMSSHDLSYCGLMNTGNTCYINSVIQVLRFCPGFLDRITTSIPLKIPEVTDNDTLVTMELTKLLSSMRASEMTSNVEIKKPTDFVDKIQESYTLFQDKRQHDTQEFLHCLLGALQRACMSDSHMTKILSDGLNVRKRTLNNSFTQKVELKSHCSVTQATPPITNFFIRMKSADKTNSSAITHVVDKRIYEKDFITSLFEGNLQFKTQCLVCEESTNRKESFFDISVPVSKGSFLNNDLTRRCGPYSLYWSLSQIASLDNLISENKYHCDVCRHLTEGRRTINISHLPPIMIIHLNRFSTQNIHSLVQVHKTLGNVAIPLYLSFSQWSTTSCANANNMYELYGIILHTGSSCVSGHYTSAVKKTFTRRECNGDDSWVLFDDETVTILPLFKIQDILSPLSVTQCTPYILFYSKC